MAFLELAESRRCCRSFTDKPVSNDDINKLMYAAHRAPSAGNLQPWHFYIINDKDIKDKMLNHVYRSAWINKAPVLIVVCTDESISEKRYGNRGKSLYCIQDTAAAIQNLLLCADDLGLSAFWVGDFNEEACSDVLKLPANHRPIALIPVGYSNNKLPITNRKPLSEIVTFVGDNDNTVISDKKEGCPSFEHCNLGGAVFDDVNLGNSRFNNINLSGVEISDANLSYGRIHDCNLTNFNIDNCLIDGMTINVVDICALIKKQG
jgi:nitroreductase